MALLADEKGPIEQEPLYRQKCVNVFVSMESPENRSIFYNFWGQGMFFSAYWQISAFLG